MLLLTGSYCDFACSEDLIEQHYIICGPSVNTCSLYTYFDWTSCSNICLIIICITITLLFIYTLMIHPHATKGHMEYKLKQIVLPASDHVCMYSTLTVDLLLARL